MSPHNGIELYYPFSLYVFMAEDKNIARLRRVDVRAWIYI